MIRADLYRGLDEGPPVALLDVGHSQGSRRGGRMGNFRVSRTRPRRDTYEENTHHGDRNQQEAHVERGRAWSPERRLQVGTHPGHGNDHSGKNTDQDGGNSARDRVPSSRGTFRTERNGRLKVSYRNPP
jgi:hypothetical protein